MKIPKEKTGITNFKPNEKFIIKKKGLVNTKNSQP